ncbi:MAG: SDR family NAD(P)-dependent oxidoreductase [Parachlamydiaceae bacterium]
MKAIIVGASSGIGKELAYLLSKEGFELGLMARRTPLLEQIKSDLKTLTFTSFIDVGKPEEAIHHFEKLIEEMGGLDLVILNSGVGHLNHELIWDKEKETIDVNVFGFTALAGAAFKHFCKEGTGHIVGISSIAAIKGNPIAPAYNASKAYMSNYLEGLRIKSHQEKRHITVTDIKPGFVDTGMAKGEGKFWVAPPRKAAEQIFQAIKKQKDHAYVTKRWRFIAWMLKSVPDQLYARM